MASGVNLLEIIDNIVDLSKIQSSTLTIKKRKINLNTLLEEILDYHQNSLFQKNKQHIELKLQKAINDIDFEIITDTKRLKQIFTNLIDNAIKFTEEGEVKFGYTVLLDKLLCFVKDTGIGIKQENINYIFDRFRQVDESSTRKYGGTGIGLALCKGLVELLKGKIWVESEIKKGTSFYFTIPLNKSNLVEKPVHKQSSDTMNWNNKRLLIAEDDSTNFELLNTILSQTKVEVKWAKNGQDAIDIFQKEKFFDAILMDINMPRMNGNDALRIIKDIDNTVPIIAQTAYATTDKIADIYKYGYDDVILKPIDINLLLKTLSKHLI